MSPPAELGADPAIKIERDSKPALTPPTSEGSNKKDDDSSSELSDLEPEGDGFPQEAKQEDDGEIYPDHYYDGGNVPVFKPVRFTVPYQCSGSSYTDRNAADHESISQLQRLYLEDRQIWNEIWHCESDPTPGMVSNTQWPSAQASSADDA